MKNASVEAFYEYFEQYFDVAQVTEYVGDVYDAWEVLLISVGVAFILGFVYLLLLRCCAGIMVFVTLVSILIGLVGGGFWLYLLKDNYEVDSNTYKYFLYGSYTVFGLAGVYLLLLLCLCGRIRLGIAIIKCTA